MRPDAHSLFGQIALKKGLITPQQLQECLQVQGELAQRGTHQLVGAIMKDRRLLTDAQITVILAAQKKMLAQEQDAHFGKAAIAGGYVTVNQVKECLAIQDNIRKNRPGTEPALAEIMVSKGLITPQQRGLVDREAGGRRPQDLELGPAAAPSSGAEGGDAAHIPGLHARHALEGRNCAFCKMVIRADQAVQICGGCNGIYHAECYAETGGCMNPECELSSEKPILTSAGAAPGTFLAYYGLRAVVALAVVGIIVAVIIMAGKSADDCYSEARSIEEEISGAQSVEERTWNIFDHKRAELAMDEGSGKLIGSAERRRKREIQLNWLKKTVAKSSTHVDAWFDMGVIYSEFNNPREAYASFKKVIETDPKHIMAHVMLGMILEADKAFIDAEAEYKAGVAVAEKIGPAHRALGVLYDDKFDETREKEAADVYRKFLDARSDPEIMARLGIIMVAQGESLDQALPYFEKANRQDPKLRMARYGRALVAFKQGRWSEASALIAELASGGGNPEYRKLFGLCLVREKRYDEAIQELSMAVSAFPRDMELHLALADVFVYLGRSSEAAHTLRTISNVYPRDTKLLFKRAQVAMSSGAQEEAKNLFERVKDTDPEFPDIWYYMARTAIPSQDWTQFKAYLDEAAKRAPADMRIPLLQSEFKRARGSYAEARAVCKEIMTKNPNFGPVYFELGIIAKKQRNIPDAIEKFQMAIVKGGSEEVYFELGTLYFELGKFEKAGEYLQTYLDKSPLAPQGQAARDQLQSIVYYRDYSPQLPDSTGKIASWVENVQAGGSGEVLQTLAIVTSAVGYLAACIRGDREKEAMFGANLTNVFAMCEQYVIPADAGAESLREQYFDFMATSYFIPRGTESAEMLRAMATAGGAKSPQGVAAVKVVEELKRGAMRSGASQVEHVQQVTKAWVRLFDILLQKHTAISANMSRLESIKACHNVQESICTNPLQKICNDLYTCAEMAGLLVTISEGADAECREQVIQCLDQMDASDREAESCTQQLAVGSAALLRIMSLIASEFAVMTDASLRGPK
jgi:tetratricopeptide (TPR) repeat protein